VFQPDVAQLLRTLSCLRAGLTAVGGRYGEELSLTVVDNGGAPDLSEPLADLRAIGVRCRILSGHGNIGYGRGHNLAIREARSKYHLILNPDIEFDGATLVESLTFMDINPSVALLTPWIGDEAGRQQFLCRRFPAVLDLFVRGILPARLRRPFARRLSRYEMRDVIGDTEVVWDPPIVSGCFMLFRTAVLQRLGGFDARYFLYFEDYDLSLRTHELARIAYVPSVRIVHHGGGAARKGWLHIRLFVTSAYKFFDRFGWKWL